MNETRSALEAILFVAEDPLTETELAEVMTHLAFYTGWPRAISAILVAKDVFEK